jgi:preprotein translocase subunit SecD
MRQYRTLILILIVLAASIALVVPLDEHPGIHFLGIERTIKTRLGLDLVGGVQVLLEAQSPDGQPIDDEVMRTTVSIVENRVNGMGVEEAVVQRAGDRYIIVEIPDIYDTEAAERTVKETAFLEFVDFSEIPVEEAFSLVGMTIRTYDPVAGNGGDEPADPTLPAFRTVMTGQAIRNVGVMPGQLGGYEVAFELTPEGSRAFGEYTRQNVGRALAIVLDKEVISAPRINQPIEDGSASITGNFDYDSANQLAVQLRYGSLPIPLEVVESRTIGATLGEDSLQKSLTAGFIGFVFVMLFMGTYYRLPGMVAVLAILSYALIIFALFRFIPVTLTLPGIAGLILSTGSALDGNILIFERLKEELRAGRTLRQAVELGFERAWPSIRDSNFTTLITCLILFWFGSAFGATIVKGFSITLAIGVTVGMFTALVVTRTFMQIILKVIQPSNYVRWFGL